LPAQDRLADPLHGVALHGVPLAPSRLLLGVGEGHGGYK